MATQRKKSIYNIDTQFSRIAEELESRVNNGSITNGTAVKRLLRIGKARDRYNNNIRKSKEYKQVVNREWDDAMALGSTPGSMGGSTSHYYKVSRKTYMGLSKG